MCTIMREVVAAPVERTFIMIDLVGYSAFTDVHGDERAVVAAVLLADTIRSCLTAQDELVKLIGDGVLIATRGPDEAFAVLERLQPSLARDDFELAVRVGVHHGSAIPIGADYLGGALNLTARLAHAAKPGRIYATDHAAAAARNRGATTRFVGVEQLRHVTDPVAIHAITLGAEVPLRLDPVCHMRVTPANTVTSIEWDGRAVDLCSTECEDRFRTDPNQYVGHLTDC
jgi:adenylate cyclase